ncbi:COP23 domain-containing protein [Altericista sp. CCNU0014]|uniref:COP23 domain-containing protein n=1 Tax=Altericista sp. CCNU0014 TaxID=3082949 RepID=UPI003851460F
MNPPIVAFISASLLAGAAALSTASPVAAQTKDAKFLCGTSQGSPATLVQTARGNITVIRWVSNVFGEEYAPEYRCRVVSAKFQQFHTDGKLNYLTTGIANNQPVVCVASTKGGPCSGVLFTLKSGSDPLNTLTRLMNVRVQAGPALNESTAGLNSVGNEQYIDVADFLSTAPTDSTSVVEAAPSNPGLSFTTPAKGLW